MPKGFFSLFLYSPVGVGHSGLIFSGMWCVFSIWSFKYCSVFKVFFFNNKHKALCIDTWKYPCYMFFPWIFSFKPFIFSQLWAIMKIISCTMQCFDIHINCKITSITPTCHFTWLLCVCVCERSLKIYFSRFYIYSTVINYSHHVVY